MKQILFIIALAFFMSPVSHAGTGRDLLKCSKFSIVQSEQSLGFEYKPGRKGVHDEYIMIFTPVLFQAPGYVVPIRSTTDGEYKGARISQGIVDAYWETTAGIATGDAKFHTVHALLEKKMLAANVEGSVRFIVNGVEYLDQCISTEYTQRLLLR